MLKKFAVLVSIASISFCSLSGAALARRTDLSTDSDSPRCVQAITEGTCNMMDKVEAADMQATPTLQSELKYIDVQGYTVAVDPVRVVGIR